MRDVLLVGADIADDVAFHDLHVIDVIEQLHSGRIHALHHGDAEFRVIPLIARVIYPAVQQLDAKRHFLLNGERRDP